MEDDLRSTFESILSGETPAAGPSNSSHENPKYTSVVSKNKSRPSSKLIYMILAVVLAVLIVRPFMCKPNSYPTMMLHKKNDYDMSDEEDYRSDPLFQPFD